MRGLAIASGIIMLTAFGAGVTELSLASNRQTADQPVVKQSPQLTHRLATPKPSATPSATPSPTATPGLPTATTNGFVHLRAGTSTATTDLADLQAGTTVELTGAAIGLWQPVRYNGINGFIYTPYLAY